MKQQLLKLVPSIISTCSNLLASTNDIPNKKTKTTTRKVSKVAAETDSSFKILQFFKDDAGEYSMMRLLNFIIVTSIIGFKIWGMFMEKRFISFDWPEVTLLASCLGSKALQSKFEGNIETCEDPTNVVYDQPRSKYSDPNGD